MTQNQITSLETRDVRFPLEQGAGSDAVHSGAEYAFATTLLATDGSVFGTGIVLTLGQGNQLVCEVIEWLGKELIGREIEELMLDSGRSRRNLPSTLNFAGWVLRKAWFIWRLHRSPTHASICGPRAAACLYGGCCWISIQEKSWTCLI